MRLVVRGLNVITIDSRTTTQSTSDWIHFWTVTRSLLLNLAMHVRLPYRASDLSLELNRLRGSTGLRERAYVREALLSLKLSPENNAREDEVYKYLSGVPGWYRVSKCVYSAKTEHCLPPCHQLAGL